MAIVGVDNSISPMVMILAGIAMILFFAVLFQTAKLKKYTGNSFVGLYLDCYNSGSPLGMIYDKSNKIIPFKVESATRNDGLVEAPTKWTMLAPELVNSSSHARISGGPEISTWVMPYSMPVGIDSTAALCNLAKIIKKHPRLGKFGNERKIISLLCDNTKAFEYNCAGFASIYYSKYKDRLPKEYLDQKTIVKPIKKERTPTVPENEAITETIDMDEVVNNHFVEYNTEEEPEAPEKVMKKGFLDKFRKVKKNG